MDTNTAQVLAFGIFLGLPTLCITAFSITRLILDYLKDRQK